MSALPNIDYYKHPFTLTEAIDKYPQFEKEKKLLSQYDEGSPEYFKALLKCLPLQMDGPNDTVMASPVLNSQVDENHSPVYRNVICPTNLLTALHPSLQTGYELFQASVKINPENDCIGVRLCHGEDIYDDFYTWESYSRVNDLIHWFGSGLLNVVNLKRNSPLTTNNFKVALWAPNRREWMLTDMACQAYSLADTALYDTLGVDTSAYILNKTESPVVVCSKDKIVRVLEMVTSVPTLNTIISMDELSVQELHYLNSLLPTVTNANGEKISVLTINQVIDIGKLSPVAPIPPKPSDTYTISFTSGTTGLPKGVKLDQLQYSCSTVFSLVASGMPPLTQGDKQCYHLSVLPLAHISERELVGMCLFAGAGIGFLHKPSPLVIGENLAILKPHFFSAVPRIYTRFEGGIKAAFSVVPGLKRKLISSILESRETVVKSSYQKDGSLTNKVQHKILIDKLRDQLGFSRCDFFFTGSAPISPDTILFLRSILDVGFKQGYGLTECFAGICISCGLETTPGSCGPTGVTCEVRLRSIPSMNYYAKNLQGELMLRGPQVFTGYFKNKEETEKCLDSDGWFATGDVARIDEQGRIYIIDRVKNFFKLAQGEYIAPEKIENTYLSCCPLLTQLFVHGDSLQTYLVAIAGIDIPAVKQAIVKDHPEVGHFSDIHFLKYINDNPNIKKTILVKINNMVGKSGLQGFEKLHNVQFDLEPLRVADETITPTLKIKRAKATKFFESTLHMLYEQGSLVKLDKF